MSNHLKAITDKARKIRKKGEKWTSAVRRASKMVPSLSPSKKASRRKPAKKKAARKKADYHQTGKRRSIARDKRIKAKPPGKRTVKTSSGSHSYYERRANRSDKPGTMTGLNPGGAYRQNVMARITSNVRLLGEAETRLEGLKRKLKAAERMEKPMIRRFISDQRKYISEIKKDISGFKSLLR